jgi:hypothetical protein
MLQNQIVHLKNVIVFKIIFCILVAAFLVWRVPISYDQLQEAMTTKNVAQTELEDAKQKIQYVINDQSSIDSAYAAYIDKLQHPTSSCVMTAQLTSQYKTLANTFRLKTEPVLSISPTPIITPFHNSRTIETFAIVYDLSFQAQGFKHALSFIKDAYQLLPKYGSIYAINISEDEVITPDSIAKLGAGEVPQLIQGRVGLQVTEVRAIDRSR